MKPTIPHEALCRIWWSIEVMRQSGNPTLKSAATDAARALKGSGPRPTKKEIAAAMSAYYARN